MNIISGMLLFAPCVKPNLDPETPRNQKRKNKLTKSFYYFCCHRIVKYLNVVLIVKSFNQILTFDNPKTVNKI